MRSGQHCAQWIAVALLGLACSAAAAVGCRNTRFESVSYTVCQVDLSIDLLEIFYLNRRGQPLKTFDDAQREILEGGRELLFAMNGGIFDTELRPEGLLVANGQQLQQLNLRGWPGQPPIDRDKDGNFYKLPNAVFWLQDGRAFVADSASYRDRKATPILAIQSGPMLVKAGLIPTGLRNYNAASFNRNAVCAQGTSTVEFVISNQVASILQIAQFMQRELKCTDALYLDGCRSALFSKALSRSDKSCPSDQFKQGLPMGPMVGVAGAKPGTSSANN